jgi:DNA-binding SARP family transcriptional activator
VVPCKGSEFRCYRRPRMSDAAALRFGILGPLEVTLAGEPVDIGGPKQRALLTLLVLRPNEVISSDELMEHLWSGQPPDGGAGAVHWHVARLRRLLQSADSASGRLIETRGSGYALRVGADQVDVARFERLLNDATTALREGDPERSAAASREALDLWRGRPLRDVAYESFAQMAIARLEELRLAALETRLEADLALGRHDAVIGELRELVGLQPTRERLAAQLMLALYRAGRQADALDAYREIRRRLDEELGLEPGADLQRLERAILNHDPSLEGPPSGSSGAAPSATVSRPTLWTPRRSILIVGSDAAELEEALAIVEPLARSRQPHELILARLLAEDQQDGLAFAVRELGKIRNELAARNVEVRVAAFTSADRSADIVRGASEQDVDLVILRCPPAVATGAAVSAELAAVLRDVPADVALLGGPVPRGSLDHATIVTPFSGGGNDWGALELSAWLAAATGGALRLAGSAADPATGRRDASRLLAVASLAVQELARVLAEPVVVEPTPAAMLAVMAEADVAVLALPTDWAEAGLGRFRTAVLRDSPVPVLLVRSGVRPGGLTPPAGLTRYSWSLAGEAPR